MPKSQQLVVTFAAGYIAGVFCAIVSHPADSVVSKLNSDKGSTAIQAAKDLGWRGKLVAINDVQILLLYRSMEGTGSQNFNDRDIDRVAMVHLRFC